MKINPFLDQLKTHYLFKNLTPEKKELLKKSKFKSVPAGQLIWSREEVTDYIIILLEGQLKISLVDRLGHEFAIRHIFPVDSLGDASIVDIDNRGQMADVWTVKDCHLLYVYKKDILKLINSNHKLTLSLCSELSRRINNLTRELELQVFCRGTLKIIYKLLQLKPESSNEIKITHKLLAELVGMSRERLTLTLEELENKGYIEKARGKITIQNYIGLKDEIENLIFK